MTDCGLVINKIALVKKLNRVLVPQDLDAILP